MIIRINNKIETTKIRPYQFYYNKWLLLNNNKETIQMNNNKIILKINNNKIKIVNKDLKQVCLIYLLMKIDDKVKAHQQINLPIKVNNQCKLNYKTKDLSLHNN